MDRTPVIPPRLWIPALVVMSIAIWTLPRGFKPGRSASSPAKVLAQESQDPQEPLDPPAPSTSQSPTEPSAVFESPPTDSSTLERSSAPEESPTRDVQPSVTSIRPSSFVSFLDLSMEERVQLREASPKVAVALRFASDLWRQVGSERGLCSFDRWAPFVVFSSRVLSDAEEDALRRELDRWVECAVQLERRLSQWGIVAIDDLSVPIWIDSSTVDPTAVRASERWDDGLPIGPSIVVQDRLLRQESWVWIERYAGVALGEESARTALAAVLRQTVRGVGGEPLPEWWVLGLVEICRSAEEPQGRFVGLEPLLELRTLEDTRRVRASCLQLDADGTSWSDWWTSASKLLHWFESQGDSAVRDAVLRDAVQSFLAGADREALYPESLRLNLGLGSLAEWERAVLPESASDSLAPRR